MSNTECFKILSLDGGGVRGYLSAKLLANVEDHLNRKTGELKPLGERFDFIAGTSTGGLIAMGLACGYTAAEVLAFYEKYLPRIFGQQSQTRYLGSKYLAKLIGPAYRNAELRRSLEEFFGDKTLRDLQTDVLITSVSLPNALPRLHKTEYAERNHERSDEGLVDVALATAAAPTFFPAHSTQHSHHLIDGGICANNPAMLALVDAFQFERPSQRGTSPPKDITKNIREQVMLLSVGTGQQGHVPYNSDRLAHGGRLSWARPISDTLMEAQSMAVHFQVKFILGEAYFRINPDLTFPMELDAASEVDKLKNLASLDQQATGFLNRYFGPAA
jgi:patatin-like phospholipase/acyl hydrolase